MHAQVVLLAGNKTAGRERHLQGEQVGLETGVQLFKTSTCRAEHTAVQYRKALGEVQLLLLGELQLLVLGDLQLLLLG